LHFLQKRIRNIGSVTIQFSSLVSFQDKQLKSESAKRTEAAILAAHKKKEREAAKQGKQPFFIKKCIVLSPSLSLSLSALACFFFFSIIQYST
jgi:ribosomal RNA-processing protein 36